MLQIETQMLFQQFQTDKNQLNMRIVIRSQKCFVSIIVMTCSGILFFSVDNDRTNINTAKDLSLCVWHTTTQQEEASNCVYLFVTLQLASMGVLFMWGLVNLMRLNTYILILLPCCFSSLIKREWEWDLGTIDFLLWLHF